MLTGVRGIVIRKCFTIRNSMMMLRGALNGQMGNKVKAGCFINKDMDPFTLPEKKNGLGQVSVREGSAKQIGLNLRTRLGQEECTVYAGNEGEVTGLKQRVSARNSHVWMYTGTSSGFSSLPSSSFPPALNLTPLYIFKALACMQ